MKPETPNHALQRTGAAVTAPASCLRLSPAAQGPRQPRRSLSLGSLGVMNRIFQIAVLLVVAGTTLSAAEDHLAPKVDPLTASEISQAFAVLNSGKALSRNVLHRALISDQTALRADAAEALKTYGDISSVPFLIDALSDSTSYVGGGHACFGKPGQNTTRYWANESLKHLTRQDFAFRWDATIPEREAAIKKWKQWFATSK